MNLPPDSFPEVMALLERYPFFTYAARRAAALATSDEVAGRLKLIASLQQSGALPEAAPAAAGPVDAGNSVPPPDASAAAGIVDAGSSAAIDAFLSRFNLPPLPYTPAGDSSMHMDLSENIPPSKPESPELTEESARILIKNRKYADALTIIEQLYLINPEKSIYFADQIRFLKKLILNQARANR